MAKIKQDIPEFKIGDIVIVRKEDGTGKIKTHGVVESYDIETKKYKLKGRTEIHNSPQSTPRIMDLYRTYFGHELKLL